MRDPRDAVYETQQDEIERLNAVYEDYVGTIQDGISDMAEEIADMVMTEYGSTDMNVNEWLTKDIIAALRKKKKKKNRQLKN